MARSAGYDGVEIMGSEGYLINQFIATRTNKRVKLYAKGLIEATEEEITYKKSQRELIVKEK